MAGARKVLLCCTLLLVVGSLSTAHAAPEQQQQQQHNSTLDGVVLIVEYSDAAVAAAAASAAGQSGLVSTSAAQHPTVAAAVAAAEGRGASPHRQEAVATIAAEAVSVAPAVALITRALVTAADAAGVKVTGLTNYHTVLKGAAIKTSSVKQSAALRRILKNHPDVKHVFQAGSQSLVKPIRSKSSSSKVSSSSKAKLQSRHTRHSRDSHRERERDRQATDAEAPAPAPVPTSSRISNSPYRVTAVDKLRESGLDGSGVLVCVVDTGINFLQPAFGHCSAVNHPEQQCKVVTGYNLVGDSYAGTRQGPSPVAGGLPTDCMGHGSMVASVVGTKNGVAPGVTFGAYRVFGCSGYVSDNVLIEAIDRAVRDGCDIINLSLASGSGYAETSIYNQVMKNAIAKGVIFVKAAGNSGTEGPFRADVATAVGSITVASVDADAAPRISKFSSYGPDPTLDLLPHIAAPGGDVPVRTMDGSKDKASGTSFAAPYVSGVLALWLQHKQAQAAEQGVTLSTDNVSQAAAMRALVATAKGVPDRENPKYLESVALMGAGLLQAESLINNQLEISPMAIQVPTGLEGSHTAKFTLTWTGPPSPNGKLVTYQLKHQPSVAIPLSDGWYGSKVAIKKVYAAADVEFNKEEVVIDTSDPTPVTVKVTFTLPEELHHKRLLFSGLIKLLPVSSPGVPTLTLPYQGYGAPLKQLRLAARVAENSADGEKLRAHASGLCYSPKATPSFYFEVMDHLAKVPDVCTGGLAKGEDDVIKVDFDVIHNHPECSLRFTLAPEVPLERLEVELLSEEGQLLGSLEPLVPSSGGALAKIRQVMSYCTRFDGSFTDPKGRQQMVAVGSRYRLRVSMVGPVALADAAKQVSPRREEALIRGMFQVTSKSVAASAEAPAETPADAKADADRELDEFFKW